MSNRTKRKGVTHDMRDIVLYIIAPMACFCPPDFRVERYSYDVPTPSAIRGVLNAIYGKPQEFYWQVKRIEVMNPIRRFRYMANEIKNVLGTDFKPIDTSLSENHTQTTYNMLLDVKYRVTANIISLLPDVPNHQENIEDQAIRRIRKGQCYHQPYLGMKHCPAFFEPADMLAVPIPETRPLGHMTYDTYVPYKAKSDFCPTMYSPVMINGVIEVPPYDDPFVIKVPDYREQPATREVLANDA